MKLETQSFSDLSATALYEILKLRTDIFVVEQDCAYAECDDFDQEALHVLGTLNGKLVAYARILPAGTVYDLPSIGRVAVVKDERGNNLGNKLFDYTLQKAKEQHKGQTIKVQAQTYLEEFYKSFGFKTISEPYPDFGVWHVDMVTD